MKRTLTVLVLMWALTACGFIGRPTQDVFTSEASELADPVVAGDTNGIREAGADIAATGTDDMTLLHLAIRSGQLESVTTLLDVGADPDVANPETGLTALKQTCKAPEGGEEPMRILIDAAADVNHANLNGDSALMSCAATNRGAMVLILLEAGADPTAETSTGSNFQDFYFSYDQDLINDRAEQQRRDVVAWLEQNGIPLHPAAEPNRS